MTRSGHGALRLALAFGLAAAVAASPGAGGDTAPAPLVIDPGTFVDLPAGRTSSTRARSRAGRSAAGGPRIELLEPRRASSYRVGEPVTMHARFLPAADGAAPDMETLKVRVRQGRRGKDVTALVKPYVQGAALFVPLDLSGHAGEFRFEMDVMDERGRMGGAGFRVTFRVDFRDALRLDAETQGDSFGQTEETPS